MEKFVIANDCTLRILDTEKGDTVIVLVHGFFESLDVFDTLVKQLKQKYRVIALDVPGHGISEVMGECHSMEFIADTIYDILKQLSIDKCYIAGHSMGGYIAASFAYKYQANCKGLIMIHSIFDKDSEKRSESRSREISFIKAGKKELLAKINPSKGFAKEYRGKYKEMISNLEDQAIMTDDEGVIALLNGMKEREDLNDFARTTSIPILCFWGKYDEFFPLEYATEFVEKHANIKSIFMEESGHMCFIEQQNEFIEALDEFINN